MRFARVLVTGGAGFVGGRFVDGLLAEGLGVVRWEILRGWKPSMNSEEAVRYGCRELLRSMKETCESV